METQVKELMKWKNEMSEWKTDVQRDIVDLSRQSHKECLIISGPAISRPEKNENATEMFCGLIEKKFGINVPKSDVSNLGRILKQNGNSSGKE